ncbi:RYamide receptor-like [Anticarsia gemmatalis]|uniref:RYamide receptor-like n=1 Tax=Anticarsia gemmatalis TaxID=129554 RepID=UPI003F76E853
MLYASDSSTENVLQVNHTVHSCSDYPNVTYYNNHSCINDSRPPEKLVCVFNTSTEDIASHIFQICVYIMYSAVIIVALLGNGLVCFVVHTTPRMKTVTNYFIVNLAVGDILMTLFCVPFSFVSQLLLRYWPFGAIMCKAVNYSQAVSVLVSAYTLLAISIDRYIVIMRPLKPRLGKTAAKLVVIAVWIGAFITAAPIPIVSELQRPSPWHEVCEVDVCGERWSSPEQSGQYTIALLVLQFALPLSALVCTYARIAYVVWGGRPPGEAQHERDKQILNSKRKMVKMMVTVVAVFTICWLPLNVFIVAWTVNGDDVEWSSWQGWPYVWFASHWLAMSHSCYNPIIYCYMNARYRRGFKQILGSISCLKMKDSNRSFQRSSVCEGVPLSEMVGANGTTIPRRGVIGCMCRMSRSTGVTNGSKCTTCTSLRQLKLLAPPTASSPPARALSVRSHFS